MKRGLDVRIGINPISWSNDDLPSLGGETPLETALSEGKAIGYEVPQVSFPKSLDQLGRQWTDKGEDKPTSKASQ